MIGTKTYVPELLRRKPIWVLWRLEADKNGRLTKVPYSALTERHASSTDSRTWSTFSEAFETLTDGEEKYSGLGVMITRGMNLIFIDIDHCIDSQTGELSEIATDILQHFPNDYVEVSQSGTGIHILTLGVIPKSFKNSVYGVEVYDSARYCAFTMGALQPSEPSLNQDGVMYVYNKYKKPDMPKRPQNVPVYACTDSDEEIIRKAGKNCKFIDLFNGKWEKYYGSQSEADCALCTILAFWCDRDREVIDRIFRSSALYRPKWDLKHFADGSTYGQKTIEIAVNYLPESISEWRRRQINELNECILSEW